MIKPVKKLFLGFLVILCMPSFLWADIDPITVVPTNSGAGAVTSHRITFKTTVTLPRNGKILIDYSHTGFGISGVTVDPGGTSINGSFTYTYDLNIPRITIIRSGNGDTIPPGTLQITLQSVTNVTSIGNYSIIMETKSGVDTPLESGTSSDFLITHGAMHDFVLTAPSEWTAGVAFPCSVKNAQDQYGNFWSGQVVLEASIGGGVSPAGNQPTIVNINVTNGNGIAEQTLTNAVVTVLRGTADGEVRYTGPITVNPGSLNSFSLMAATTQTAGIPFILSVTNAKDNFGNIWSGNVEVSTISGGGDSPNGAGPSLNDITVVRGAGQAYQTLVKAESGVDLQGHADGKFQIVYDITVIPGNLASLKIRNQSGGGGIEVVTQSIIVGQTLNLYSAGYDAYGNYRGDENTNWTSYGLPDEILRFNTSLLDYTPTQPGSGTIKAANPAYPDQIFDNTGTITVTPGPVSSFVIDPINTQVMGIPFLITIRAVDVNDYTATDFTGRVRISDLTGTINPSMSGDFIDGVWTNIVTVYREWTDNTIIVQQVGGPASGVSTPFNVIPSGIRIVDFKALQADTTTLIHSVTTGQEIDWFVKLKIENLASVAVRYDSVQLQFLVDNELRNDYVLNRPTVFWGSGSTGLQGGTTDSLLIRVDRTGIDPGAATVQSVIYLTNTETGAFLSDRALVTLAVQTPANLVVQNIQTSQPEVSRGQEEDWTATVYLTNTGGSAVTIDTSATSTFLSFDLCTGWQIDRPESLGSDGWVLSGGKTDYLVYSVTKTGDGEVGTANISATIGAVETNTGRFISYTTPEDEKGQVLIEHPAYLRILNVKNSAPNAPYVNTGQDFSIQVTLENDGDDGIHDVQVLLISDGQSMFPPLPFPIHSMDGGEIKTVELPGTASNSPNFMEVFTASAEGYADNTGSLILNEVTMNDTTKAIIQTQASLNVQTVMASVERVVGGQVDPWTVKVAIRNTGQAIVNLHTPNADDLSFWAGGLFQADYKIQPPASLKGGGLRLYSGVTDTLIYSVITTGRLGGPVEVRAQIKGVDANTGATLTGSGTTSIEVQSEQAFRIISTHIQTPNKTDAGNGFVNTEQYFKTVAVVENGLGQTVRDIQVRLTSDGASLASAVTATIPRLRPTNWDTVKFDIQASSTEDLTGEMFTATITQATLERSELPAPVGPALDSTATVFIQRPADISLVLELSNPSGLVSTNQTFQLRARLINDGTAAVDTSGRVRISLPATYNLDTSTPDEAMPISTDQEVEWSIQAPPTPQSVQLIYVTLDPPPLEKNTGIAADVEESTVSIPVTTVQSWVSTTLSISSPVGAIDNVISAGQSFVLKATVQSSNVKDITARIELPYGFTTSDDAEKNVPVNVVSWNVQAPPIVMSNAIIQVRTNGIDALKDVPISPNLSRLTVSTVLKANLVLSLSILSPPDATDGTVSLGQRFVVGASIENTGQADTLGITQVTLSSLPSGYDTDDPLIKTLVAGKASWSITAPLQPTGTAVNIEASITEIPWDENTYADAFVSRGNHSVAVTTEGAWLAVSSLPLTQDVGSSVVPGQDSVKLMILELDNRGIAGANQISVSGVSFIVEDRLAAPIAPNTAFSRIFVIDDENGSPVGSMSQIPGTNPVSVPFSSSVDVPVNQNRRIAVYARIAQAASASFVQVNLPSEDYIDARDRESGIDVPVRNLTADELENVRSEPKRIFHPELETTFRNVPNPFGEPGKEQTLILYYLDERTDVRFHIYTLTGELVWSASYTANDPQGKEGMHSSVSQSVTWDGHNDRGLKVLNGVYILVMETGYGEVKTAKVAVVK